MPPQPSPSLAPPQPMPSSRPRTSSTTHKAPLPSPQDSQDALIALAAGAGFFTLTSAPAAPTGPMPPYERVDSSSSEETASVSAPSLSSASSASSISPPWEKPSRPPLRSNGGRLVVGLRAIGDGARRPIDVDFRIGDRTSVPRSLLRKLDVATAPPPASCPEPLRPVCTSLFVHGAVMNCLVDEDADDLRGAARRRASRSECTLSLGDFTLATNGKALLQRDGEVEIVFP